MTARFKRPIVYWPVIGCVAALFSKGGADEWSAWAFWLGITLTIALILEWRRSKNFVFALGAIPLAIFAALLFQESIRQPGTFTTSTATAILKKPFPRQYGANKNILIKELPAGTNFAFEDTIFGKDFAMYRVVLEGGEEGFVESTSVESVQLTPSKFPWDKIMFWLWMEWLIFAIVPIALYVGVTSERERLRFAKAESLSRREIFLKLWVPPYSWRMGKRMGTPTTLPLTKTLVIYLVVWFWAPFVAVEVNPRSFDFGDWVQFALLCALTVWGIRELNTAYRRRELKRLLIPTFPSLVLKQSFFVSWK